MKNLKALIIRNGILSQAPNYLPESLRILEWHTHPFHCPPPDFDTTKLAIRDFGTREQITEMSNSIEQHRAEVSKEHEGVQQSTQLTEQRPKRKVSKPTYLRDYI